MKIFRRHKKLVNLIFCHFWTSILLNDALNQYLQNQLASIRASCGSDSSVHNQFYAHNTQMFRAHFKAHKRLLAFFLTKEIPTHERIAVQNICMRSINRLGEICS